MSSAQGDPATTPPEGVGTSKTGIACIAILIVLVALVVALPILASRAG